MSIDSLSRLAFLVSNWWVISSVLSVGVDGASVYVSIVHLLLAFVKCPVYGQE